MNAFTVFLALSLSKGDKREVRIQAHGEHFEPESSKEKALYFGGEEGGSFLIDQP